MRSVRSNSTGSAPRGELGPRAVTYPYRRIERIAPTEDSGPDPYGEADPEWMRVDWSEHLRRVELDGAAINYAEIGEGEPILFVHGLGGCWQNWLENMPHFAAAGRRAIALDLPGFGHSPLPEWKISIPAYGRMLDEFCQRLGLSTTTVVGNSMGGFIAAEVAIHKPEWIDYLVLVSAAGISHAAMRKEPVMASARMLNLINPLAVRLDADALRRPRVRQLAYQGVFRHPQRVRPELLFEFTANGMGTRAFLPAIEALHDYDFLDRLPTIAVPTLLIWGRDDLVVPASDAPGYHERIPESELHVFADCSHVPMAERPVRFNRLVERFVGGGS